MSEWHHHHDGDDRLIFCRAKSEESDCSEEYDGLICDGQIRDEATLTWGPCRWHLAFGEYVVDVGEQLALVTHLEAAPALDQEDTDA